jgi:tRNA modification GTPase
MTIFTLSTGLGLSGIAVIRVSGPETENVIKKLIKEELPNPRLATLKKISKINSYELIDEGIYI